MTDKKLHKPAYYRAMTDPALYSKANATIKHQESEGYWVFKTGPWVYKVIKPDSYGTSKLLLEAYANELVANSNRHSPAQQACVLGLCLKGDQWSLESELAPGSAEAYVIKERQLSDRGFLTQLLAKDKAQEKYLKPVAQALWNFHQESGMPGTKGMPDAAELAERLKDRYYQAKKFLGQTITQTMIDLSARPLDKYLISQRKLIGRRMRKGFVGHYHGAFGLSKIHWSPEEVSFLTRSGDPMKERYGDRASDVADLCVDLHAIGKPELADHFVAQYLELSGDTEMSQILPVYKALKALKLGLKHSVLSTHCPDQNQAMAKHFFELVVTLAGAL